MFFFFVCGEHTFQSDVEGYENIICQCHNCGNMSGHVLKRRPFFTFCWIPIIPFTISGYKDISCHICRFNEPLERRPDVQSMKNGGVPPQAQQGQQFQPQGYQGYTPQQPPDGQAWGNGPPKNQQQGDRYA
ncbi:hypothetical protein GMORB2_1558 [Geosmithia morbida]|uniref:Rhodopsin family protein n=1 Tax=Geosmithia morbida TaxID=1094350 RepID=A0A9P4YTX8_9HYPO|nr:uncharacterized protein GMORB2_1558 [Geosmithia morbida]KAF4121719.1 hypothetical protein GMORB2_1558 [Geosmithia morbida]